MAGRNAKANIFQKGNVGFMIMMDLKKKKRIKVLSPFT
jgi:hypothetical protein